MMGRLEETATAMARSIDQFIDKHRAGVMTAASAASAAGNFDRPGMTRWLLLYHKIYADFLTMLSADSAGNITTATSNMTGFLTAVPELLAHNVADRNYFR
ncbi:MAG: hypothetical protein HKN70_08465 [Gammaproteobacteria bacterium]|nr:hypothetical protein [Gammaproteobacteria bacterium]